MKIKRYIVRNISIYLLMILVLMSFVFLGGTSFALIKKSIVGSETLGLQTGNFLVEFTNSNIITLNNKMPMYDDAGMISGDELSFSVTNNGNYRASYSIKIEETSEGGLKEVIRYGVDYGDGYEINNVHALINNSYIVQDKRLNVGETDSYNVSFWIDIDASEYYSLQEFTAKLVIEATQEEYKYATDVIEAIYNKEDKEGVTAIGEDGNIFSDGKIVEYRYSGVNVNNYVWFNCEDGYNSGLAHCEKWRIVGSFINTHENGVGKFQMLKIVRDEALSVLQQYNLYDENLGDFDVSSIKEYLNGTYYNEFGYDTKKLIFESRWNIGNTLNSNAIVRSYGREKERNSYNYVGLLGLSDFGYAADNSFWNNSLDSDIFTVNNNWLYLENMMFLNTPNHGGREMYFISSSGIVRGKTDDLYLVRPVVFLKPDVSIIGGLGTSVSPYKLGILHPMMFGVKTEAKLNN